MHILFHRGNPWRSDLRGSTKIFASHYLQAGYQVSYLQSPTHPGTLLRKGRTALPAAGLNEGVWVGSPFTLLPTQNDGPFSTLAAAQWSYRLCVPPLPQFVRLSGYGDPAVIWTTRLGSGMLRRLFPKALLVFQVVDYYPAFGGAHTQEIERYDYKQADHLFSIGYSLTHYLQDELGVPAEKITTLGQGVDLELYQQQQDEPADIADLPHPRAIWVGLLDKADPDMMRAAADVLQMVGGSLILVGPPTAWAEALAADYAHVRVLGTRKPPLVPAYLLHSDIGLMLYHRGLQEVYRGQNPLKLCEYAAAGLAILSTPHDEYRYQAPPALVIEAPERVAAGVRQALQEYVALRTQAHAFVQGASWHDKFLQSQGMLQQLLGVKKHVS